MLMYQKHLFNDIYTPQDNHANAVRTFVCIFMIALFSIEGSYSYGVGSYMKINLIMFSHVPD